MSLLHSPRTRHLFSLPTGPRQVASEKDYERAMIQWRSQRKLSLETHRIHEARAFVSGGAWVVRCACGNAPLVEPHWRRALCFACAADYRDVVLPEGWEAIEAALLKRPRDCNRHWHLHETLEDLLRENAAHGV